MQSFSSAEEKAERQHLIRLLQETPPQDLVAMGEALTLTAFKRVADSVPFYSALLTSLNISAHDITDLKEFCRRVPMLDKHNTFGKHRIADLCVNGDLAGIRTLLTSSGHSGVFSFGVNTQENLQRSANSIDMGLQYLFDVDNRSTLLINCLPMGVKVNTRATFLAETSVRDDMVFAVIKKFRAEFDQIILVGEGSFIKKIIEDGRDYQGIDWPNLAIHIITGEEGIAENYRTYLGELLGIRDLTAPHGKLIGSSMGVAELDLNIFHETRETIEIRRLAHADPELRKALFGSSMQVCPMLFVYYPQRCFVEEMPIDEQYSELLISMLSAEMKIPLLRYRSGDYGRILPYEKLVATLKNFGHFVTPDLKLPFVAVYGRGKYLPVEKGRLFPEAVKEALYLYREVAEVITGNFKLSLAPPAGFLEIQLRKGSMLSNGTIEKVREALRCYVADVPKVLFHRYEVFPYAMEVDYERKFNYLPSA